MATLVQTPAPADSSVAPAVAQAAPRAAQHTCVACRVAFASPELQRDHHKSDWHRYNLKRKVAALQPVTEDEFLARLQQSKQPETPSPAAASSAQRARRTQPTPAAPAAHSESKAAATVDTGIPAETNPSAAAVDEVVQSLATGLRVTDGAAPSDADEQQQRSAKTAALSVCPEQCLFCAHRAASLDLAISHMERAHSFYIPDREYLVDPQGLLAYLGNMINDYSVCIFCPSGHAFANPSAARKHMIAVGHCRLRWEHDGYLEYSDFYDFSPSYANHPLAAHAVRPHRKPTSSLPALVSANSAPTRTGRSSRRANDDANGSSDEGDDDSGDDDEYEDVDVDDEDDVMDQVRGFRYNERTMELILPSGVALGHRSLKRYYRQRFRREDTRMSVVINKVASTYRALGWAPSRTASLEAAALQALAASNSLGGTTAAVRSSATAIAKSTLRSQRFQQHRHAYEQVRWGIHNNDQKHFRQQVDC
jgi:pre-60S factor REI1